jgi:hypothetical protein
VLVDVTRLTTEVDRLADRLRATPQSALLRGAAAEAHGLAAELVRRAQLLEFPGREPHPLPDVGPFAVGDQLAVAGHEMAAALTGPGGTPEQRQGELEAALRLVAEVRARL